MWSKQFWMDAVERAVKTAAQVALGMLTALTVTTGFEWDTFLIGLGTATGLSFVTSVLSSLSGASTSASAIE